MRDNGRTHVHVSYKYIKWNQRPSGKIKIKEGKIKGKSRPRKSWANLSWTLKTPGRHGGKCTLTRSKLQRAPLWTTLSRLFCSDWNILSNRSATDRLALLKWNVFPWAISYTADENLNLFNQPGRQLSNMYKKCFNCTYYLIQ